MSSLSTSLLDFILGLLRDPQAAAGFEHDPQAALSSAGLGDVCSADVKALMPMLADYAPVGAASAVPSTGHVTGQSAGHSAGHSAGTSAGHSTGHSAGSPDAAQGGSDWPDDHGGHDGSVAIEHIRYIQANYSYTTHTTNTTTIDASHSIWGDAYDIFGDDNVVATHGSIAAGDDIGHATVDNSSSVDNSTHVDVSDSFNPSSTEVHGTGNAVDGGLVSGSFNPETTISDSGNTQTGTGNVVGEHNDTDTDHSGNTVDSGNTTNSGNEVHGTGNAVGGDADSSTHSSTDLEVSDSGNTVGGNGNAGGVANEATSTDLDLHAHDIVVGDHDAVGNETHVDTTVDTTVDSHDDNSENTTFEHSFDGNHLAVAGDDLDQSQHLLSDNDVHLPVH